MIGDPRSRRRPSSSTIVAVVVLLAGAFASMAWAAPPQSDAAREIQELENKVNAAYAANDLPAYFSFYAPDFTQWLPTGRTDLETYRKEWTNFISSGGKVEGVDIADMHIQIGPNADTAVATYRLQVKTRSPKGQVDDEAFQETDVWFKRAGAWKIVHLHYSPAPKAQ